MVRTSCSSFPPLRLAAGDTLPGTFVDDAEETGVSPGTGIGEEHHQLIRRTRLKQIVSVLTRHGLGYLPERFGLGHLLPFQHGLLGHTARDEPYTRADHLRLALEELGTTAIKIGQILSTRADLLPPAYIDELAKLRDHVPAVPVAAIRSAIERELGRPLVEIFASFDDEPLASASIGQVHAARLPSGEQVVIKIQKPGIAEQVDIDLRLLLDLARIAQRRSEIARQYDLVAIVEEFAWTLRSELDYEREGRNADAFRTMFADNPDVVIPTIDWTRTTTRVLTMQRLDGIGIDDGERLARAGIDRKQLAKRSANLVLTEVFDHGFYHADPHPGNFLVLQGGVIGALDFGLVGRIGGRTRLDLLDLLSAVIARDADRAVDVFGALGVAGIDAARLAFTRDISHLFDRYLGRPLQDLRMDELIGDLFALVRRHRLRMPTELVLLLKTLAMNEGVGRSLDPSFNVVDVATPFAHEALQRRLQPTAWEPQLRQAALDLARLGSDLPAQSRRLLRRLDQGEFTVGLRRDELDEGIERLERMVNRLVVSMLLAALIVAVAMLMLVYHPGSNDSWIGSFFAGALVLAILLGLRLALSARRSGRR